MRILTRAAGAEDIPEQIVNLARIAEPTHFRNEHEGIVYRLTNLDVFGGRYLALLYQLGVKLRRQDSHCAKS